MSQEETKKLSQLDSILKLADKYEEITPYTLSNGEEMEYYPYFSSTKLQEIAKEFQEYAASEDKTDKKFMDTVLQDELSTVLFYQFLAIKKFTHFGEQMKRIKKVRSLVPYYEAFLKTGLLQEIVDDVFLFEELSKLNQMFGVITGRLNATMEFVNSHNEELTKQRENFKKTLAKAK